MKGLVLIAWIAVCYGAADAARILAFVPFPAKSHQRVIQPLIRELAVRGHHVTCVSPYPLENPPANYTYIQVQDYMKQFKESFRSQHGNEKEFFNKLKSPLYKFFGVVWKFTSIDFAKWVLTQDNIRRLIDSDLDFDLILLETTFLQEPFIALSHKFKAPVVEFVPLGNVHWSYWLHGNPIDPSYIEDSMLPYTDKMSFHQRLLNTVFSLWTRSVGYFILSPIQQGLMDEHIRYPGWESRPSMLDMISDTSLVLVNTHFSINYPYPDAPHVKSIGGLNIVPTKPLPRDIQSFMDSAKDGVIYFTLGSHLEVSSLLDEEEKQVFSKVFGELKQKVLWKWETNFTNPPSNVKISSWFPQQDILAHKNCKLFITHCGLLSLTEAVNQGIPMLGIPFMPDQDKNAVHMEHFKYGVQLQPNNITYESLKWALNEVLNNPEYRENAMKRKLLFRDKPETALETATYWTEYVLRHNGAHHLRPYIAKMPWYQQALLDVYAAMALIIIIPSYICFKIISCLFRCICCRSKKVGKIDAKKKKE